jgi:hypothetical protein
LSASIRERITDRFLQLVGFARHEAVATAGARECGEIRIGKVNALLVGRYPDRLGLQPDQAKRGVIVDDNLDRQLVVNRGQELAHKHVEAAVAGQCSPRHSRTRRSEFGSTQG